MRRVGVHQLHVPARLRIDQDAAGVAAVVREARADEVHVPGHVLHGVDRAVDGHDAAALAHELLEVGELDRRERLRAASVRDVERIQPARAQLHELRMLRSVAHQEELHIIAPAAMLVPPRSIPTMNCSLTVTRLPCRKGFESGGRIPRTRKVRACSANVQAGTVAGHACRTGGTRASRGRP